MKINSTPRIVRFTMLFFCLALITTTQAQTFQNLLYGDKHIEYVAGMVVYDNSVSNKVIGYIAVGNTREFTYGTRENIVVTRYDATGAVMWVKHLFSDSPDKIGFWSSDVQPEADPKAISPLCFPDYSSTPSIDGDNEVKCYEKSSFYISGHYETVDGIRKMLLLKVDYNANIIWTRTDIANYVRKDYYETGVSVEVDARSGDVFIVGLADHKTKLPHTIVARFTDSGTLKWVNRYIHPCNEGPLGYIPRQSVLFVDKYKETGIAVCGRTTNPSFSKVIDHAFISRINADGSEAWRMVSIPDDEVTITSAEDITTTKTGSGYIFATTGYFKKRDWKFRWMYNFTTDDAGTQLVSHVVHYGEGTDVYGQSIINENGGTGYYIISGGFIKPPGGARGVLLTNVKIGSVALWSRIYETYSFPNFPATESVYSRPDGYYLATNGLGNGGSPAALVIATDNAGFVNNPDCEAATVDLQDKGLGFGAHIGGEFTPENKACPIKAGSKEIGPERKHCYNPSGRSQPDATRKTIQSTLQVFPNPANNTITVNLVMDAPGQATASILRHDGTRVQQQNMVLQAGANQQSFNISQLPAGGYLLQITLASGRQLQQRWVKQ
jgi:Secretion system C-terminal sorting domain